MDDARIRGALQRLKRGDINGLALLVQVYQVKAVRAVYLVTSDRALAEDIVQEAFVRVYERIEQFDSSRPFEPWFMRVVVNEALQATRQQQRRRQVSLDHPPAGGGEEHYFAELLADGTPSPEDLLEIGERREAVRQALAALTPEQRAVIVLRYYLGLSEAELASELDIPSGTVKWRLHAARKQLRGLLGRWWHPASVFDHREA